MILKEKYIDPFTDFGFKKLFGSEPNKELPIDFLNQVLPQHHHIKELSFRKTEQLGSNKLDRNVIFDIYCVSQTGERFIVEMQKAKQTFSKTELFSTRLFLFGNRQQREHGILN